MTLFLIAIHHSDDYDPALREDAAMAQAIDALNLEMVAAEVRRFVGGLTPIGAAKAVRTKSNGQLMVTDGPYLETREHIAGFWVLDVPDMETALEWGCKAAAACRAPVEVRAFN